MNKKKRIILSLALVGVIFTLTFALCACDLFQSVDDYDSQFDKNGESDVGVITLTVECTMILDHPNYKPNNIVPVDGIILSKREVEFYKDETVFSILMRLAPSENLSIIHNKNPLYDTEYISAVNNIREKTYGGTSGWIYLVDGEMPTISINKWKVRNGEDIVLKFSC